MNEKKLKNLNKKFEVNFDSTSRNRKSADVAIERYLTLADTIKKWKFAFWTTLILLFGMIATSVYLMNRSTVYPYIVKVDNSTGEVVSSEILKNEKVKIGNNELEYFLKKVITDMRTITKDKNVFQKTIKDNNLFFTKATSEKYQGILTTENVIKYFEEGKTRDVEILSFTEIPEAKNTYQIRWREREYSRDGSLVGKKNMNSIIKIDNFIPTKDQISKNPFGIVITDFNMNQEN